jgi:hypothetical protein
VANPLKLADREVLLGSPSPKSAIEIVVIFYRFGKGQYADLPLNSSRPFSSCFTVSDA